MKKEELQDLFNSTDYRWLLKGILAIYNQQTKDEQVQESTNRTNHRGFRTTDAKYLCSFAKQILNGFGLTPKQLAVARRRMPKYAQQCLDLGKKGIRPEDCGKLKDAVMWTERKNSQVKSQAQRAQEIVDEMNKSGRHAIVGCCGGIINFDDEGHMRDF